MPGILNSYTEIFKPKVAIIAYEGNHEREQEWYIESHPIENGIMLEGKPLQQETLQAIMGLMYNKHSTEIKINKFIPPNLLHADLLHGGDYKLIWYRPEEIRVQYFASELPNKMGRQAKSWVPAMLYMATKKKLHVHALKSNDYPTEETRLFRAPFYNTSGADGLMCRGSATAVKPTQPSYQNLMKYHEDLFWGSEFSSCSTDWHQFFTDPELKWRSLDLLKETSSFPRIIKDLIK